MNYKDIRKLSYSTEEKVLAAPPHNFNMNDWLSSPYTCFKVRLYIELASIFVFLLQFTSIKPNHITYIYAFSGLAGGVLLANNNSSFIILGIIIFFSKVAIDGTDGLLARVKYKPTKFGAKLDQWGGLVGEYGFLFGLGFYVYNITGEILYLQIMITTVILKSIDFKKHTQGRILIQTKNLIKSKKNKKRTFLKLVKEFIRNGFNFHGKTIDFILLIMLIEIFQRKLIISHVFLYLYLLRGIIIFFGNLYVKRK